MVEKNKSSNKYMVEVIEYISNITTVNIVYTYGLIALLFSLMCTKKVGSFSHAFIVVLIIIVITRLLTTTYFVSLPYNPSWQNVGGVVFVGGEKFYMNVQPIHITSQISIDGPILSEIEKYSKLSGQVCIVPCADGDPCWNTQSDQEFDSLQPNDQMKQYEESFGEEFIIFTSCIYDKLGTGERHPNIRLMPWSDKLLHAPRYKQENFTPYRDRKNGLVWRGEKNGMIRSRVMNYLKDKTWADAEFVPVKGRYMKVPEMMSQRDQANYKLILAVDGWSYPSSIIWALESGSVVVMISAWKTVLQLKLVPWVHYVPVSLDLHDFEENVNTVLRDDELGERIVQNAKKLFESFDHSTVADLFKKEVG
jgi:hypothetical protein